MPTRLYRDDSYLTSFTARVVAARAGPEGLLSLELDRTAFYPTGGGQPHDTGTLGGLSVVDVREEGDGRIVHIVKMGGETGGQGETPSGQIEGCVNWRRRFDHMQQHTGQHILSRAFVEAAGAATRSFHLGDATCTIDVELADPSEELIRETEARGNEVIFGDEPVAIEQLPPGDAPRLAADLNLARELALKPGDPIRVIRIGGFDETPCGGTHVRRSGEVGAVAIRSFERFKGGTRVSFLCGGRVVRALAGLGSAVDACVVKLSAQPAELPGAIARLQEQLADARRMAKTLNEALVGAEAVARDASARLAGSLRAIVEVFPGRPIEDLQLLAQKYTSSGARLALLAATDEASGKASLIFARSEQGTPADLKMGDLVAMVCRARGGKGGGGATLARGGGIPAHQAEAALEEVFILLSSRLTS